MTERRLIDVVLDAIERGEGPIIYVLKDKYHDEREAHRQAVARSRARKRAQTTEATP